MKKLLVEIETSIKKNKDLIDEPIIHQTNQGYMRSKDKEVLILLSEECFYGHVFKDCTTNQWVSLINWKPIREPKRILIQGETSDSVLKEYARVIYKHEEFSPCAIQNEDDAFKFNNTFEDACMSLKKMIDVFELKERMYTWLDVFHSKNPNTRFDMRIYSVYF